MLGDHPTTKLHLQPLGFYYRYFRFTLFLLMCMCFSVCECARGCLRRPEEGLKLNLQVAVRNSGPQKKQQAFWTAEPSLQPGAGEKKKKVSTFLLLLLTCSDIGSQSLAQASLKLTAISYLRFLSAGIIGRGYHAQPFLSFILFLSLSFLDQVSLHRPSCSQTHRGQPASTQQVLGFSPFNEDTIFFFSVRTQIDSTQSAKSTFKGRLLAFIFASSSVLS